MTGYLCIPNWDEMQHYKDRSPPWIKLHNELLESYEFECLQDASKAHLLCIWLLASRTGNKIKADSKWIARKIGANTEVNLDELIKSGFLLLNQPLPNMGQDASNMLQGMEQDACLEGEGEESRIEGEKNIAFAPVDRKGSQLIPYQQIIDSYNEHLGDEFGKVIKANSDVKKKIIKKFWDLMDKDINKSQHYFYFFSFNATDHQRGLGEFNGKKAWKADFEFICRPSTVDKQLDMMEAAE